MIEFKTNIDEQTHFLSSFKQKQVPYAVATALNNTAFQAKKEWQEELPRVLDRPTKYTVSGWRVKKAKKSKELVVRVEAMEDQERYLLVHVEGGRVVRNQLIPLKGVPLTKHGGVRRKFIKNNKRSKKIFFGKVFGKDREKGGSSGVTGVWQRNKNNKKRPKLLGAVSKKIHYKKRLGFQVFMHQRASEIFDSEMQKALLNAWATAK